MKQLFLISVVFTTSFFAQTSTVFVQRENSFAITAGMSVNVVSAPEITDFVNLSATYADRVNDFVTAVDFFGGIEFPVSKGWGIKLEHSYLFKSYNYFGRGGETYDFFYSVHSPLVIVQKVLPGEGYFVKIGAGGGYHFGSADVTVSTYGSSNSYTAQGVGLKVELEGQTAFDENLYGYISGQLGWEFLGELKDKLSDKNLTLPNNNDSVSLRYFFAGIRFGLTYYL